MSLLTIVIALGFLQVWGAKNPLHYDGLYTRCVDAVSAWNTIGGFAFIIAPLCFIAPLGLIMYGYFSPQSWMGAIFLAFSVVILLYSLGRGEFVEIVAEYTKACYVEDWSASLERAESLEVNTEGLEQGDWSALHERVLEEASYRGFERMFAVIFWFVFFGPLGALYYRLLFLYCRRKTDDVRSAHLLWAMEWVPARLLALSFSFTGNFVGSWGRWRELLFCFRSPTHSILSGSALGALSVAEDTEQTCEVTRKELNMLGRLYARTLWFWLGALALLTLLP